MVSVGELRRKYKITEDQAKTLMVLVEHSIAESTSAKLVTMSPKLISILPAPVAAEVILKDLKKAGYSFKRFQGIKEEKSRLKEEKSRLKKKKVGVKKKVPIREWKKRRRK